VKAKPLQPGDIVDVVAPASRCSPQELKAGVAFLKSLGLRPRVPHNLFDRKSVLFANTDEQRLSQLKKAVYAPDSKMIWCIRGGYGCLRLMPSVRRWKKPARPKIFLGYSDITTLHAHFNQAWKWPTVHGPMLERAGSGRMSAGEKRALLALLFGRVDRLEFKKLKAMNKPARKVRTVKGVLWGGNMAVLQSALGTPSALKPNGHILFFEDTGEAPHRVDRMLSQFAQAGWFGSTKAIVFGHFLLKDAKLRRQLWTDVLPRFAASVKFPVFAGLPVGHSPTVQFPLPFNTPVVLKTGSKAELVVQSGIGK
jgi:muramoyltetrapeptide carboxypeptidase